jgi:hypothetical protein
MKFNKNLLAVAITSVTALSLYGCGTDKQDGGKGSSNAVIGSGIAVDGPIVRAQVFYDLNGNKKKDSYEPGALTDNNGHYNRDYINNIDYCSGASARPEFCLSLTFDQSNTLTDDTKIIVTGGYDLYTGEPFEGSMSFPAKSSTGLSRLIAITPLTSMMEAGSEGYEDFIDYLRTLAGLTELTLSNILNLNFLESEAKFNAEAFAITYQMHKYVTVISDWVKEHYSEIEDGEEITSDISGLIYRQFSDLNDKEFDSAWESIRSDIDDLYVDVGETPVSAPSSADVTVLVNRLTAVNSATTAAFGNNLSFGSDLTFANVKGRTRGVEVVVLKIIRDDSGNENAHIGALNALSDDDYLENLEGNTGEGEGGNINFSRLVETNGDEAAFKNAAVAAKDTSGSNLASDLAGKMLEFEDDGSDEDLTAKAALFFTGAEGATRGNIHLCLKYEEVGKEDERLSGDYISGSWETVAALNNTVMLRLNYLGGRSAVLKKVGAVNQSNLATKRSIAAVESNTAVEYRFDFSGETSNFTSDQDLIDTPEDVEVITTKAACELYVAEQPEAAEEESKLVLR